MSAEKPGLHEIARALSERMSVHDAASVVAGHALAAFQATGVYVERCVGEEETHARRRGGRPHGEVVVEVLASAGEGVPQRGVLVPYPGSLSATSARTRQPEVITWPDGLGSRMMRHVPACESDADGPCQGMIVPLVAEGHAHGALVIRRGSGDPPFTAVDVAQARPFGDLAAAALSRLSLIEALRESEGRLRQVAEHLREFIWLSDPTFTTHYYVNVAYERIWGRSRASLYADARSLLDAVHVEDRERVTAALLGMPRGDYDIEFRVIRPDGEIRWVWSRGFPVLNAAGEVYRIAGITEDITDRKHVAMERERLLERERQARLASEEARATAEHRRQELERVTESRARLIRGFTHDVKNPLGAADGFLVLLLEGVQGELTGPQRSNLERARRSIRSALDLIAHALELARAEAGDLEIRHVAVDVRDAASQVAEELRAQADAKGLSLVVELPAEPAVIESDRARIVQVLGNLVSNAVKYTPRGGRVAVHVDPRPRGAAPTPGEWVAIHVVDTGRGISPDEQAKLFQEFTRFAPNEAQGSGVGLAISQCIAQALGGAIRVESKVGAGSTFSFWLPRRG